LSDQKKGFTIIEVIVGVLIISVAIVGIAIGFSGGLAMVNEIRQIATADRIAQEIMEELRGGESLEAIPSSLEKDGVTYTLEKDGVTYTLEKDGVTYTIFVSPSTIQTAQTALTQVTVAVSFESHTGRNISRRLATYFTENGITKK